MTRGKAPRLIWKKLGFLLCLAAAACTQDRPTEASEAPSLASSTAAGSGSEAKLEPGLAASLQGTPTATLASQSAAAQPASVFAVNTVLGLDRPLQPNDYVWDDEGVAEGPIGIVIDLTAQRLYVYRAGVEIGRSVIIYGADDKPTPTGTFPILEKDIDHVSNIYDGAPMPYMLRLTWDGIAIHGSGEIGYEYATHGCIGLPDEFAAILYEAAGLGDQVLVTNSWMTEHYAI